MNLFFPCLEIIIIIFIGFACSNRKLFDEKQIEGFQTFLFTIATPCFLFASTLKYNLDYIFHLKFIFSFLTAFLITTIITIFLIHKNNTPSETIIKTMAAGYGNAAIYALPIIIIILDNPSAVIVINLLQVIIIQFIFTLILSLLGHGNESLLQRLFKPLLNPLIFMPILGLICNYLNFKPGEIVVSIINRFGSCTACLSLFVFGLTLAQIRINKNFITKEIFSITLVKTLLHPLLAFIIGKYVFSLSGYWLNGLIIGTAAPTAFVVYRIAFKFKTGEEFVKLILATTSIISLLLIIITLTFLTYNN